MDMLVFLAQRENAYVMPHLVGMNEAIALHALDSGGLTYKENNVSAPQWPHGSVIDQALPRWHACLCLQHRATHHRQLEHPFFASSYEAFLAKRLRKCICFLFPAGFGQSVSLVTAGLAGLKQSSGQRVTAIFYKVR